ncbi:uncharacterized protein LOC116249839 [Nymphaea colorata]|nr:uncharacterized protein LOC116249839 [Nymphaea colorata]
MESMGALMASPIFTSFTVPKLVACKNPLFLPIQENPSPFLAFSSNRFSLCAKKKTSQPEQPTVVEDEYEEIEEEVEEELDSEIFLEDDDAFDFEEEPEPSVGDGVGGGGIVHGDAQWEKEALSIAKEVVSSFDGELQIYAFKTSPNFLIQVRIERLSNKSGSPSMDDIEAFSTAYRARLDDAERTGGVPENIFLEVSSPGVERLVRVPEELDRFKERPMYVRYVTEASGTSSAIEQDGVFNLDSVDYEARACTWRMANVRKNREKLGKGRSLSKKQKEWRLTIPFETLRLVRLHSDC